MGSGLDPIDQKRSPSCRHAQPQRAPPRLYDTRGDRVGEAKRTGERIAPAQRSQQRSIKDISRPHGVDCADLFARHYLDLRRPGGQPSCTAGSAFDHHMAGKGSAKHTLAGQQRVCAGEHTQFMLVGNQEIQIPE